MSGTHKFVRPDDRNSADAFRGASPIIRSAVAVVRESAGLLEKVAAFGLALVFEPEKAPPRRPIAPAPNVIPFPTNRPATQKK